MLSSKNSTPFINLLKISPKERNGQPIKLSTKILALDSMRWEIAETGILTRMEEINQNKQKIKNHKKSKIKKWQVVMCNSDQYQSIWLIT